MNYKEELRKIANRPKATRCYKGTNKLTKTSIDANHTIHHANLLLRQSNTAGGIMLKKEILTFLSYSK